MMRGSELKLHEFKGGVGEGEGGADGDRKVVSVDHGQSTTTCGTWKRPQLVARRCQVDTLTLVAVSFDIVTVFEGMLESVQKLT